MLIGRTSINNLNSLSRCQTS